MVANQGSTIDATKLNRLFEPFFRAEERGGEAGNNQGLGWIIVAAIARLDDGDVFASSQGNEPIIGFSINKGNQYQTYYIFPEFVASSAGTTILYST